jgi:hypothetical protein
MDNNQIPEVKCLRCGICCHLMIDNKLSNIKCRYLVKVGKKTLCRIYQNRIGKDIGHGLKCHTREEFTMNIPGCPYNREEWKEVERHENT